jgi:uncharacterized protein (TIGR03435 family)
MLVRSKGLTCIAVLSALALSLIVGSAASSGQAPVGTALQGDAPAPFDKLNILVVPPDKFSEGSGFLWGPYPNGWSITNVPLLNTIAGAYGLGIRQIIGFPSWVETDPYDLFASMDADKFEAFKKLSMDGQLKQRQLMMQASLAGRCQLKAHRETREMPVYKLVVAKGGLKKMLQLQLDQLDAGGNESVFFFPGGWWYSGTMESLARNLAGPSGRIVVDKTGLGSKRYFNALHWASDGNGDTASGGPSIFKALEEQLGLELVPATEPVDVLVIDHIEKPTAGGWPAPGSKLAH